MARVSKLVVLTQRGIKINEYRLNNGALTIGRGPGNDVQINNPGVSARHARLEIDGERPVLQDLGSRNGTYVNLDRITRKVLEDGDTINFPNCKLRFVANDDGADESYNDFETWWRARKSARSPSLSN